MKQYPIKGEKKNLAISDGKNVPSRNYISELKSDEDKYSTNSLIHEK